MISRRWRCVVGAFLLFLCCGFPSSKAPVHDEQFWYWYGFILGGGVFLSVSVAIDFMCAYFAAEENSP